MASLSVNFQLDSISGRIVAPNFCDGDTAQYHPYVIGEKAGCRYRCLMENAQIHFATELSGATSFSTRNRILWASRVARNCGFGQETDGISGLRSSKYHLCDTLPCGRLVGPVQSQTPQGE